MTKDEFKKIIKDKGLVCKETASYLSVYSNDEDRALLGEVSCVPNDFRTQPKCSQELAQVLLDYAFTPLENREDKEYYVLTTALEENNYLNIQKSDNDYFFHNEKGSGDAVAKHTLTRLRGLKYLREIDGEFYLKLKLIEVKK